MKITFTNLEAETFFHSALCNGLSQLNGYSVDVDYKKEDYAAAKKTLVEQPSNPCYEDVLLQILREGKELQFVDEEGEDTKTILLADVHTKMSEVPAKFLIEMISENDDADTADVILQTIIYGDIIFG